MVNAEKGFIYRHRCDDSLNPRSLTRLFSTFAVLAQGEERGRAEKVKARPLRALTRRLATALEFDPADPWRRSK